MSPARVPCRPQARNTPSMAAAVMITGTIIGAMIRLAISPAPGIRARARPTAAAVPAAVATVALGNMMVALVALASRAKQKNDRQRTSKSPIAEIGDLHLDELGDHRIAGPAQQGRRNVVSKSDHEHEHAASDKTGQAQRQIDAHE